MENAIQAEKLMDELKIKMIETLQLEDVTPDEIDDAEPLVGGSLGIDSIDILELVMMLEKDYGVKIENKELGKRVFANLKSLAEFVSNPTGE